MDNLAYAHAVRVLAVRADKFSCIMEEYRVYVEQNPDLQEKDRYPATIESFSRILIETTQFFEQNTPQK